MIDDPDKRREQAFEECRKVFTEYHDLVDHLRQLTADDRAVLRELLAGLDGEYFKKLNELEAKVNNADEKGENSERVRDWSHRRIFQPLKFH